MGRPVKDNFSYETDCVTLSEIQLGFCGTRNFFSYSHQSFDRSFSCSGVIFLLISSAYPKAVTGCEPRSSHMRGERVTTTLPTHCARPIERRPSNWPGCGDLLTRQSGHPSQVASHTFETHWTTFWFQLRFSGICILFIFTPISFERSSSCSGVIILVIHTRRFRSTQLHVLLLWLN
ncbi:hypothetical protein CSKR_104935 [Clonorchis sinensis]|uniref:Uncharacterized protein n=1 Tax=Clonorchis sinensis TaxID=79923 RepID=A0A419Q6L9_CLOSI|nr:hypothetical protein CSKR_104935 [Clonorchis sinensis]